MIGSSFCIILLSFRPSILATISKKRTTTTTDDTPDETEAKKSKFEPTTSTSVFKKPLPMSSKPKKSALEEVREVIYQSFFEFN